MQAHQRLHAHAFLMNTYICTLTYTNQPCQYDFQAFGQPLFLAIGFTSCWKNHGWKNKDCIRIFVQHGYRTFVAKWLAPFVDPSRTSYSCTRTNILFMPALVGSSNGGGHTTYKHAQHKLYTAFILAQSRSRANSIPYFCAVIFVGSRDGRCDGRGSSCFSGRREARRRLQGRGCCHNQEPLLGP